MGEMAKGVGCVTQLMVNPVKHRRGWDKAPALSRTGCAARSRVPRNWIWEQWLTGELGLFGLASCAAWEPAGPGGELGLFGTLTYSALISWTAIACLADSRKTRAGLLSEGAWG